MAGSLDQKEPVLAAVVGGQLPVLEVGDQRQGMTDGPGHGQSLDLDE